MNMDISNLTIFETDRLFKYWKARGDAIKIDRRWNHATQRYITTLTVRGLEMI